MDYCFNCMKEMSDAGKCPHCGFDNGTYEHEAHHLRPHTILYGKYLVGRVLGEGGFGITYVGLDLNLDMKVAIKEYYPNGCVTRTERSTGEVTMLTGKRTELFQKGQEQFIEEARRLAKFWGLPGIVSVKDFFQENGTAYIVMEFAEGQNLKQVLEQCGGRIGAESFLKLMRQVMHSLQTVHEAGMIHRDISPDNLIIDPKGNLKLLDFGAARNYIAESEKSLSVILKPGYAPEEQYRSRGNQGPWTDVYALCATIYRAITGTVPAESLDRLAGEELKTPSQLGIRISAQQERGLMKGLALKAEDRYQSMKELEEALFAENVQPAEESTQPAEESTQPAEKPTQPVEEPTQQAEETDGKLKLFAASDTAEDIAVSEDKKKEERKTKKKRRRKRILVGIGAVCALLVLTIGVWMFTEHEYIVNHYTTDGELLEARMMKRLSGWDHVGCLRTYFTLKLGRDNRTLDNYLNSWMAAYVIEEDHGMAGSVKLESGICIIDGKVRFPGYVKMMDQDQEIQTVFTFIGAELSVIYDETMVPEEVDIEYENGDRYVGQIRSDMKRGTGTYYWADGRVYTGEFSLDKMWGQGKMTWPEDESVNPDGIDYYEGEWENGVKSGTGTMVWLNGKYYEGEWYDDEPHGEGKMVNTDSSYYEGEWENGLKHGTGTHYYADGSYYVGEFAEDKRHGAGIFYDVDGNEEEQYYINGFRTDAQ